MQRTLEAWKPRSRARNERIYISGITGITGAIALKRLFVCKHIICSQHEDVFVGMGQNLESQYHLYRWTFQVGEASFSWCSLTHSYYMIACGLRGGCPSHFLVAKATHGVWARNLPRSRSELRGLPVKCPESQAVRARDLSPTQPVRTLRAIFDHKSLGVEDHSRHDSKRSSFR